MGTSAATPDPIKVLEQAIRRKAESIGKVALRNNKTAQEAAHYINNGNFQGYGANHKDSVKQSEVKPTDWFGQAEDKRWLVIHANNDSTPKS